jgi:NhaP-type Na+/H+ or K+/H+ antiporter
MVTGTSFHALQSSSIYFSLCMRGFVTMATAFALPDSFPQRDTVVLTAFCVVIATLVLQSHPGTTGQTA